MCPFDEMVLREQINYAVREYGVRGLVRVQEMLDSMIKIDDGGVNGKIFKEEKVKRIPVVNGVREFEGNRYNLKSATKIIREILFIFQDRPDYELSLGMIVSLLKDRGNRFNYGTVVGALQRLCFSGNLKHIRHGHYILNTNCEIVNKGGDLLVKDKVIKVKAIKNLFVQKFWDYMIRGYAVGDEFTTSEVREKFSFHFSNIPHYGDNVGNALRKFYRQGKIEKVGEKPISVGVNNKVFIWRMKGDF